MESINPGTTNPSDSRELDKVPLYPLLGELLKLMPAPGKFYTDQQAKDMVRIMNQMVDKAFLEKK